jgi:hypothetical protein
MPEAVSSAASCEHPALAALRERGAARVDPVRFRLIEALARRAQAHEGAARRVLDERLAALLAAAEQRLRPAPAEPAPSAAAPVRSGGPLAELAARLSRRAAPTTPLPAASAGPAPSAPRASPVDAESLQFFRRTWSRLSAEQRLAQSRSALPENAGPLNSHQIVHRALSTMRELSPAYFEQFMAYADALLWLEHAQRGGGDDAPAAPRAEPARKSVRAR